MNFVIQNSLFIYAIWAPLKGIILTGKYLKSIPEDIKLGNKKYMKNSYEK